MDPWRDINITEENLELITSKAIDFALAHGFCIKDKDKLEVKGYAGTLPLTLFPSPFSKQLFLEVQSLQEHIQFVYHKVAHDHEFLVSALETIAKSDEFIGRLLNIYKTVRNEGKMQPYSLGIIRTDYLLNSHDGNNLSIKQVETNTIACSFATMSTKVVDLHRYVLKYVDADYPKGNIIDNNAVVECARGLYEAWKLYNNPSAVIIFIVEDLNYNVLDQTGFEYQIMKFNPNIKVFLSTYGKAFDKMSLDSENKLFFGQHEVAVIYFRSGYHSKLLTSENDWNVQLLMERSKAVKCPSVHLHLAGCKKIQQLLCKPGVLEKYIQDDGILKRLRNTFAAMYSLDLNKDGDEAAKLGIKKPNEYVLKPQREGGGNNLYDEALAEKLKAMGNSSEREAYILMERIMPTARTNYLFRRGSTVLKDTIISELGIYGVIISKEDKVAVNYGSGHLLRSKPANVDEGGVAAGYAYIDSPYLL